MKTFNLIAFASKYLEFRKFFKPSENSDIRELKRTIEELTEEVHELKGLIHAVVDGLTPRDYREQMTTRIKSAINERLSKNG